MRCTPSLRASNGCVEAWQSTGGAMVMQYGLLRGESARNDGLQNKMVEISTPSLRASNGCVEAWQSIGDTVVMTQYGLLRW